MCPLTTVITYAPENEVSSDSVLAWATTLRVPPNRSSPAILSLTAIIESSLIAVASTMTSDSSMVSVSVVSSTMVSVSTAASVVVGASSSVSLLHAMTNSDTTRTANSESSMRALISLSPSLCCGAL